MALAWRIKSLSETGLESLVIGTAEQQTHTDQQSPPMTGTAAAYNSSVA